MVNRLSVSGVMVSVEEIACARCAKSVMDDSVGSTFDVQMVQLAHDDHGNGLPLHGANLSAHSTKQFHFHTLQLHSSKVGQQPLYVDSMFQNATTDDCWLCVLWLKLILGQNHVFHSLLCVVHRCQQEHLACPMCAAHSSG